MKAIVLDAVREVVRGELGIQEPVELVTDLVDDLGLDSLALLTLTVSLENRFEVCLEFDAGVVTSVGDVVDFLAREIQHAEGRV